MFEVHMLENFISFAFYTQVLYVGCSATHGLADDIQARTRSSHSFFNLHLCIRLPLFFFLRPTCCAFRIITCRIEGRMH